MPDYQHVILEKDPAGHIARSTINRPDRRNALNDAATGEMGLALEDMAEDDDIRVLILTGAGGSFCAGGDLNTRRGGDEAYRLGFLNRLVEEGGSEATTMEMARKIAAGPPIAIRLSKLMLYKGLEFDLETALKMAAAAEAITLTSQDHGEGAQAIRESRKPFYEGR